MATQKKQSLFAQRMQNAKKIKLQEEKNERNSLLVDGVSHQVDSSCFGDRSNILHGPDAEIIHQENVRKLLEMTPQEIEEERQKLLANIDPSVVDFFKSRKSSRLKRGPLKDSGCSSTSASQRDHIQVTVPNQIPAAELMNKYPHMDVVEPEKMQWMQDVLPPKPPISGCPYNARFNFEGELLPYDDTPHTDGLYHHGEEPERPGYTLQELMQLSRSSMLQQRITAVSTLSNIFHKASDYDYCLDKPLLPQLLDSELYLLLRFTLDDPVPSVVSTAVAAISNLLVNTKDEGCLDRLLGLSSGLRQPLLYVHLDLQPNELAELKDTELLKVDVIRGALRTHLLPRFRYILDKLRPEPVEVVHVLRCLTRITRHSLEAAHSVINAPGLLVAVRKILDEPPPRACSEALKLFRVLACQSHSLAAHLVDTHNIMEPIQRFIAGYQDETSVSLALESLYTWQTLLTYQLTDNYVSMYSPVVKRLLITHAEHTSLDSSGADLEHATALVSWVTCALRINKDCARDWLPALHLCARKWLSQAPRISSIKWAACKMLGALLHAAAAFLDLLDVNSSEIKHLVNAFLCCENFTHLTHKLRKSSWLLQGERSPSVVDSLPCLGSVPPTLYDDSPLPLIMGLAVYVYTVKSPQLSVKLASAEGVHRYLEEVTAGIRTTTCHWFARQEIALIYTLLQIHLHIENPVENSLVHQAALFLSTSIHMDDRYLLTDLFHQVIFNKHFFRPDIENIAYQLQDLDLSSDDGAPGKKQKLLNEALDSLETIGCCYQSELGLAELGAVNPPPSMTASHGGTEPALPADWHYQPIVHLSNIDGDCVVGSKREDAVSMVTSCLQWTLVLESRRPLFVGNLAVAARFCRLACVLTAGSDLFRDVREWLREVLQVLLTHNRQMNFDEDIPGIQSFYDFYRQILEQFVGVSYGDPVFGQFVLVPLQQRHSIRLRKLVWCELAAVLRFLSTPVDQVGVPLDNFLEPCETDPDLLFIYLKALGLGRVKETFSPVLFRTAVHHVATYVSLHAGQPPARRLQQMIDALGNQELKSLLTNYSAVHLPDRVE